MLSLHSRLRRVYISSSTDNSQSVGRQRVRHWRISTANEYVCSQLIYYNITFYNVFYFFLITSGIHSSASFKIF